MCITIEMDKFVVYSYNVILYNRKNERTRAMCNHMANFQKQIFELKQASCRRIYKCWDHIYHIRIYKIISNAEFIVIDMSIGNKSKNTCMEVRHTKFKE